MTSEEFTNVQPALVEFWHPVKPPCDVGTEPDDYRRVLAVLTYPTPLLADQRACSCRSSLTKALRLFCARKRSEQIQPDKRFPALAVGL